MRRSADPAGTVALSVQPHFARHVAEAREQGVANLAPVPDAEEIEAMIHAAFWASLRREEGYVPTISLAFLPPSDSVRPLRFEHPFALAPAALARLAPAVERPGIHLGVWREGEELYVWGTLRELPAFCFVLEVIAPGLLVVKQSRTEEAAKYVNVAVIEGDSVKVLNEGAASLPDCPTLVTSLLGFGSTQAGGKFSNVLVQLAVSMRAHGRGGSLLVVPGGSDTWRESIVHPVSYAVSPPFSELAELVRLGATEQHERGWQDALRRAVAAVAGLTAVDGATIITGEYELLAFGAKIGRRDNSPRVEQVMVTEPIAGSEPAILNTTQLGGTRHYSAAQFTHDQRDALALVASQDGQFTIFAWSPCEDMVHAHRVEALLL